MHPEPQECLAARILTTRKQHLYIQKRSKYYKWCVLSKYFTFSIASINVSNFLIKVKNLNLSATGRGVVCWVQ